MTKDVGLNEMPRDNIILQCTECKERNYVTTKNKKNTPGRLELKSFVIAAVATDCIGKISS